jgi:hypothetical protein
MWLKKGPKRMPAGTLVPSKGTLASRNDIKSFICDLFFAFPELGRTAPARSKGLQDLNKWSFLSPPHEGV